MASTTSRIRIIFDGDSDGVTRAAAAASLAVSGLVRSMNGAEKAAKGMRAAGNAIAASALPIAKAFAAMGSAGAIIPVIGGIIAATQQLLPIMLILPGALLAGAAAFGVFKLATSGFGDALKGDAEALAKLSPSARATANAITALKKPFEEIKSLVQEKFFAGFAGDVKQLGDAFLPKLKQSLPGIAAEFNSMGRGIAFALKQAPAQEGISKVLGNTTKLLGNMRQSLGHVTAGVLGLAGVGSTFLPRLGTAVDSVASKFKVWVDQGISSGNIQAMINNAIQGFKDLGAVLSNVGSVFGSIFSGLGGASTASPLAALSELTGKLKEFFATANAQNGLAALGETLRVVAGVIGDVFVAALKAIAPILELLAPHIQKLAQVIGTVLTEAFKQLGPPIERLLTKLGPVIGPVLDGLASLLTGVVIPALAAFIDFLASNIDTIQNFAQATAQAFFAAVQVVLGFVSATLGGLQAVFFALSFMPGEFGKNMGAAAKATGEASAKVDALRGTISQLQSKMVEIEAKTKGQQALEAMRASLASLQSKTVTVTINQRDGLVVANSSGMGGRTTERAIGGPVDPGRTYLVGEAGPELLTMGPGFGTTARGGFITSSGTTRNILDAGPSSELVANISIEIGGEVVRVVREQVDLSNGSQRQRVGAGAGRGR